MVDKITIEVIRCSLEYATKEMGIKLRNATYSPNIKERMDHSCAIFDEHGYSIAQAEHIPAHLGLLREAERVVVTIENRDSLASTLPQRFLKAVMEYYGVEC